MQHPTFGIYKTFLENVVWPHLTFFGSMSIGRFLRRWMLETNGTVMADGLAGYPMRIVTIIPALDEEAAIGGVVQAVPRDLVHEVQGTAECHHPIANALLL
jgi:hypothetical protein